MKVHSEASLSDYLDDLQKRGQYTFSREEVSKMLSLSAVAFHHALNRLLKKGRIRRVRGDFYILIPLEYQTAGSLPVTWFIDAFMHKFSNDYYVSILSAAALHGAAHQQPMVFQVIADRVLSSITLGHARLEFHYKKKILPAFYTSVKTEEGAMHVATPEMTACDMIRYLNSAGQINNVATVLIELAEKMDSAVLIEYAKQSWVEVTVLQRLGYLLEALNLMSHLDELAEWVQKKTHFYRLLVTGQDAPIFEENERWRILVNEMVEPDL